MENKLKMEQDLKEQVNKTPAKPTTENTGSFWSGFTTYSPLNYFYGTKSSESPKLSTQSPEEERLRQIQERQSIESAIRNAQEREKLKNLHLVIRLRGNQSPTEDLNNQQNLTPTPDKNEILETQQLPPNLTTTTPTPTPIIDNNSQPLVQREEELELQRQQEEQQRQQQQQLELQRQQEEQQRQQQQQLELQRQQEEQQRQQQQQLELQKQREEEQRRKATILLQQQQQAALLLQQKQHQQREAEERKRHHGFTRQEVLAAKALYVV